MSDFKAKIYYIYHSGFAVETSEHLLIFDYYKEIKDKKNPHNSILTPENLSTKKSIFVFSSHKHADHFNKKIYEWEASNPKINYVLSSDIKRLKPGSNCTTMSEGDVKQISDVNITAFGSTDAGISFLVKVDGLTIFHAGDLNWWHWKEDSDGDKLIAEALFKVQIEAIKLEAPIDIAFFPVDPRLEEYYFIGGQYFAESLHPKLIVPMHFGDKVEITKDFAEKMARININVAEIHFPGEELKW